MKAEHSTDLAEVYDRASQLVAIQPSNIRQAMAAEVPVAYAAPALEYIEKTIGSSDLVSKSSDVEGELAVSAADEFLALQRIQDYISFRMSEIKEAVFSTISKDSSLREEDGFDDLPESHRPGKIKVPSSGVEFQKTVGNVSSSRVNEALLKKEHPRIYKSLLKEVVLPPVEEQRTLVFDQEAFEERAKTDKNLQKFIKKTYRSPSFRVQNIK